MHQPTFASACTGFEKYFKETKQERFLTEMDRAIPWQDLVDAIQPYYPQPQGAGRRPVGVERMLRIHFLQHWFNLSDPAMEEALYTMQLLRQFAKVDLGKEPAPDETTICKFRHLLEEHNLGEDLFHLVNEYLRENGMKVSGGTLVDATVIHAPGSTKNKNKERDPEMGHTRKGQQCFFGMKGHIGVDSKSKLIHSVQATAANVHDSQMLGSLLHGKETRVWGDSAYTGQKKVLARVAPRAKDFTQKRGARGRKLTEEERSRNRNKSRVRAKVEHPFRVIKQQFGFQKVRYRGLAKNRHRLVVACALCNLVMAKKTLLKRRRSEGLASLSFA